MFTDTEIISLAQLPFECLRFKVHVDNLIAFYKWAKEQWTSSAIKQLSLEHNLNLRKNSDRALCGLLMAQVYVKCLPPAPMSEKETTETPTIFQERSLTKAQLSEQQQQQKKQAQVVKLLATAIAYLPPVPPTNGLEKTPPYQILGEPIYFDELVRNYKILALKWHPDKNEHPEANERFQLVTTIFQHLRDNWFSKYSPLISAASIGADNISRAKNKKFAFTASSFWE